MAVTFVSTVGAATSNSYAAVADADTYFEHHPEFTTWDALFTVDKQRWLILATTRIDLQDLDGVKNDTGATSGVPDQALHFPTSKDVDDSTEFIPIPVKRATYEEAISLSKRGTSSARLDLQAEGVTEVQIGDVREKYGEGGGTSRVRLSSAAMGELQRAGLIRWTGGA